MSGSLKDDRFHQVLRGEAGLGRISQVVLKSSDFVLFGVTEDFKAAETQESELVQAFDFAKISFRKLACSISFYVISSQLCIIEC